MPPTVSQRTQQGRSTFADENSNASVVPSHVTRKAMLAAGGSGSVAVSKAGLSTASTSTVTNASKRAALGDISNRTTALALKKSTLGGGAAGGLADKSKVTKPVTKSTVAAAKAAAAAANAAAAAAAAASAAAAQQQQQQQQQDASANLTVPSGTTNATAADEDITMRDTTADLQRIIAEQHKQLAEMRAAQQQQLVAASRIVAPQPPVASGSSSSTSVAASVPCTPLSSRMHDVPSSHLKSQQQLPQFASRYEPLPECALDASHMSDAQECAPYMNDIMTHLRAVESQKHPYSQYMKRQVDVTARMREILIDWLCEVHVKFQLVSETMYLTVSLIDRFLERRAVSRNKLQLVGCTAMLLASKYEEIYAPMVEDFVHIADKAYTREQIMGMEGIILNALKFELTTPSMLRFSERYVALAKYEHTTLLNASHTRRLLSDNVTWVTMQRSLECLTQYLCELTLQDYRFLIYLPSMLSSCALYLAMHTLIAPHIPVVVGSQRSSNDASNSATRVAPGVPALWSSLLQHHTQYSEEELDACVRDLHALSIGNPNSKYRAVRKKFSQKKWCEVSKLPIAMPLLPLPPVAVAVVAPASSSSGASTTTDDSNNNSTNNDSLHSESDVSQPGQQQ